MILKEICVKKIITKSKLPAADYVINPYVGCNHSCIYCYARFMKRFTGHDEKWGNFIDVKINAVDLIPKESTKYVGKSLFFSSVTDPYLPVEKKYKLTRGILEKLIVLQPSIGVQTKSNLIVRDIDLLQAFNQCEAGLTITTLNENIRKKIEPFASSISKRIEALKQLKLAGIKTYVFIGPILPSLTDWKSIINETKQYTDCYMFENLNMHGSITLDIHLFLMKYFPDLVELYTVNSRKGNYWNTIEKEIVTFCDEHDIVYKLFFHHKAKSGYL